MRLGPYSMTAPVLLHHFSPTKLFSDDHYFHSSLLFKRSFTQVVPLRLNVSLTRQTRLICTMQFLELLELYSQTVKKHFREVQHWGVCHLIVVYIYKAIIRNYPGRANFYSLLASGDQENYFYSKTFLDWKISDSYSISQAGKEVVIANLIQT